MTILSEFHVGSGIMFEMKRISGLIENQDNNYALISKIKGYKLIWNNLYSYCSRQNSELVEYYRVSFKWRQNKKRIVGVFADQKRVKKMIG